jgi:hypothetical protein
MSRLAFTLCLFVLAATAQAMNPARHGPNGSPSCPETPVAATAEGEEVAVGTSVEAPATPATPAAPKGATLPRSSKTGARWHSFLPGMFK